MKHFNKLAAFFLGIFLLLPVLLFPGCTRTETGSQVSSSPGSTVSSDSKSPSSPTESKPELTAAEKQALHDEFYAKERWAASSRVPDEMFQVVNGREIHCGGKLLTTVENGIDDTHDGSHCAIDYTTDLVIYVSGGKVYRCHVASGIVDEIGELPIQGDITEVMSISIFSNWYFSVTMCSPDFAFGIEGEKESTCSQAIYIYEKEFERFSPGLAMGLGSLHSRRSLYEWHARLDYSEPEPEDFSAWKTMTMAEREKLFDEYWNASEPYFIRYSTKCLHWDIDGNRLLNANGEEIFACEQPLTDAYVGDNEIYYIADDKVWVYHRPSGITKEVCDAHGAIRLYPLAKEDIILEMANPDYDPNNFSSIPYYWAYYSADEGGYHAQMSDEKLEEFRQQFLPMG